MRVESVFSRVGRWLLPPVCLICGRGARHELDCCRGCEADLPVIESQCRRCGLPLSASVEACGRCAMTSVVGAATEDGETRGPFDGDRIEIPEGELRAVSKHVVFLGRVKDRLDEWATAVTYGR